MLARVSNIETFRRWRMDESKSVNDLMTMLLDHAPTEAMLAGTAFHSALENAPQGDFDVLQSGDYTFNLRNLDTALDIPSIREVRASGVYGLIKVTGKFDAMQGRTIYDHKTTAHFDAEKYIAGCQWKFYLDIFNCDKFRWNVFEISEVDTHAYDVRSFQMLEQYRYPGMHEDCIKLAQDFHGFMTQIAPDYCASIEQREAA